MKYDICNIFVHFKPNKYKLYPQSPYKNSRMQNAKISKVYKTSSLVEIHKAILDLFWHISWYMYVRMYVYLLRSPHLSFRNKNNLRSNYLLGSLCITYFMIYKLMIFITSILHVQFAANCKSSWEMPSNLNIFDKYFAPTIINTLIKSSSAVFLQLL